MEQLRSMVIVAKAKSDPQDRLGGLIEAAEKCLELRRLSKDDAEKLILKQELSGILQQAEQLKAQKDSHEANPVRRYQSKAKISTSSKNLLKIERADGLESQREIPLVEQKLLWKSSLVGGHKYPPWTQIPNFESFADRNHVFTDPFHFGLSPHQQDSFSKWSRPSEAIPSPFWFPDATREMLPCMSSLRPIDLVQDTTTDCSVVASLCSERARVEMGHRSLLSSIMHPYDLENDCPAISPNGRYVFRFNFNGCFRLVEIDDRLPVSKSKRMLHIVDNNNPCLLWPALLEKAYLKVRGGYDFPGSNTSTDLWIIAGWVPEIIFLSEAHTETVWKQIYKAFKRGLVFVSIGTGEMSKLVEESLGLISHHNYTILDLRIDNGRELVLVKNPWCESQLWNSCKSKDSEALARTKQRPLSQKLPNDFILASGSFWIALNDVFQNFDHLYLNWDPQNLRYREEIHFDWELFQTQRCFDTLVRNPQFSLSCREHGQVWLLLCLHFKNDPDPEVSVNAQADDLSTAANQIKLDNSSYLGMFVFDNGGKRVYNKAGAVKYSRYLDSPQLLLRLDATTKTSYTIAISEQYLASRLHHLSLFSYSMSPVELGRVEERYACSETISDEFDHHNSGGGSEYPSFSINPQWCLELSEPGQVVILLESEAPNLMVNVKLCYGEGQRLFMLKRRDAILDSGEYGKASTLAVSRNGKIDAGKYTIVASTFQPKQYGKFLLRVDCSSRFVLTKVLREDAGKMVYRLPQAVLLEQTSKVAIALQPIRTTTLNIVVKLASRHSAKNFDLLESKRTSGAATCLPSRSALRISLQLGGGVNARELATTWDGKFSDATDYGLRISGINVWPSLVQGRALFLVLERQGSGASGIKESYATDILLPATDGEAVQFGHWVEWEK